jgi:ComF family protein
MGPSLTSKLTNSLANLLFPPLCVACREPVGEAGFCAVCWSGLTLLDGPSCACCAMPFAAELGAETLCAACLAEPPAFDRARAIFSYDDKSKGPILALKHADRLDLVPGFARWLERAGGSMIAQADLIVPVPLHPWRLWRRRYNQAAELARMLARRAGKAYAPDVLVRRRPTPSQGAMVSAAARKRNVAGAFEVPESGRAILRGKNVLLVDDVMTTGATVREAAKALKKAGAEKVLVLALAFVVRGQELPI